MAAPTEKFTGSPEKFPGRGRRNGRPTDALPPPATGVKRAPAGGLEVSRGAERCAPQSPAEALPPRQASST